MKVQKRSSSKKNELRRFIGGFKYHQISSNIYSNPPNWGVAYVWKAALRPVSSTVSLEVPEKLMELFEEVAKEAAYWSKFGCCWMMGFAVVQCQQIEEHDEFKTND